MDPHNPIGAPYDPEPEDALPDNQAPITDDYAQDAVDDVERDFYDNPEDVPAEDRDQLKEAMLDDMPGSTEAAVKRQLESPNEQRNQFDARYFDSDRNPNPDAAIGSATSDQVLNDEQTQGDTSDDNPDVIQRIG